MSASLVVIAAYLVVLAVIAFPPERLLRDEALRAPWWKNVRFWAAVVVVVQIAVYAVWG